MGVLQGRQEQSFMVVCDVTSENKEVIKQLEDAHVSVQHRSRTKKDSSDEVLRQQMRKVVDTSAHPGRIVLISGDRTFTASVSQNCGRSFLSIMLPPRRHSRSLQLMLSLLRQSWKKERRRRTK